MALTIHDVDFNENTPQPEEEGHYGELLNIMVAQIIANLSELDNAKSPQLTLVAKLNLFATITYMETYVNSVVIGGGAPGDIAITELGVGNLNDGELLARVGGSLAGYDKNQNRGSYALLGGV